jgi:hypothetical protein
MESSLKLYAEGTDANAVSPPRSTLVQALTEVFDLKLKKNLSRLVEHELVVIPHIVIADAADQRIVSDTRKTGHSSSVADRTSSNPPVELLRKPANGSSP